MLAQRYRPDFQPLLTTLRPFLDAGQVQSLTDVVHDIQQRIARIAAASKPDT